MIVVFAGESCSEVHVKTEAGITERSHENETKP